MAKLIHEEEKSSDEFLKDKKILITGGTSGIGRATALLFASLGANVMIIGRDEKKLKNTLKKVNFNNNTVVGLTSDVSTKKGAENTFAIVDSELGGIDILVNNASVGGGNLYKESYEKIEAMVKINLLSYLIFAKYAGERMMKQNKGHIINIGSMSANRKEKDIPVYVAVKAGIQAMSESLRKTLNPKGIKVSLIEPGSVGTGMQPQNSEDRQELQRQYKMLRSVDIARAILFCVSQPERSEISLLQIKPIKQII